MGVSEGGSAEAEAEGPHSHDLLPTENKLIYTAFNLIHNYFITAV